MIMFGAAYYYIPRLTGRDWSSAFLIKAHFWSSAFGITLYFVALSVGGWFQGLANITPSIKHIEIVQGTLPYLFLRSVGGSFMVLGHVLFALLLFLNLMGYGSKRPQLVELNRR
jgi:cytochrome c oxidase cbb3-type subunit 1